MTNFIKSKFGWLIVLFLCNYAIIAQINYQIDYDIYYDTDFPMIREAKLFVNNSEDKSLFVEMFGTEKPFPNRQIEEESNSNVAKQKRDYPNDYYVVDNLTKELYIIEDFYTELYKINDTYFQHKWEIDYKKQKEINGLTCHYAEMVFRGHKWEAWFTTEIPLPYGPWKLHGLPGLILETKNESNRYHFVATKISTMKEKFELPDFSGTKEVSLKRFIEMGQEKMDNIFNIFGNDRDVEVTRQSAPKKDLMEYDYEWEEDKKIH